MRDLRNKNQTGFTLIELLVVIAIIGLLASVVLLALNSARQKSRDAKRLADVRQIASALEIFYNDEGAYPTCAAANCNATTPSVLMGSSGLSANTTLGTFNLTPTYIGSIPSAPVPPDTGCTPIQNQYSYAAPTVGTWYTLTFCLGAQTGGYSAGARSLTPAGIN